jgi:hypothetical protein
MSLAFLLVMVVQESARQDVRFAENVALLSLIEPVPELPSSDPTLCVSRADDQSRVLSIERESYLTNGLAFLAGISDRSGHVVALCVEERPGGLRVVIAINREKPRDERVILNKVREGFQEVFSILTRAEQGLMPACASSKLTLKVAQTKVRGRSTTFCEQ